MLVEGDIRNTCEKYVKTWIFFRIPDELLLKYTKADSLCQDDYQVERNVSPGKKNAKMHCGPKS